MYVQGYREYPPVIVSAIGFRQHGKTVYFASLFYALKEIPLARSWPKFFTFGLNEDSLDIVSGNVEMLEKGELPDSTPKLFPKPTMIRLEGVPNQRNSTLLCYDTGGECFDKPTQLITYAGFVRRATTALFLISVPDMENPREDMHRLLNTYVVGMHELGARTQDQHLVVVYTKADKLATRLANPWDDIHTYLAEGTADGMGHTDKYIRKMNHISTQLRDFTSQELLADEFLNAAQANFKSVEFSIISSLGAAPGDKGILVQINHRRVLDPLMWMMEKSLPTWKQFWRKWWK